MDSSRSSRNSRTAAINKTKKMRTTFGYVATAGGFKKKPEYVRNCVCECAKPTKKEESQRDEDMKTN